MYPNATERDPLVISVKQGAASAISYTTGIQTPVTPDTPIHRKPDLRKRASTYGPQDAKGRIIFYITIFIMVFCASNNDFLGKLTYQSLPFNTFIEKIWIVWLLSFGTFFVCSLAIIFGWNRGEEFKKLKKADSVIYRSFFIAGCCHVWMNGCRYTGLLFLAAPVVTILKSGSQLLFSSLLRYLFYGKALNRTQLSGVSLTCVGLCLVIVPTYVNEEPESLVSHIIGIVLLLSVGMVGALRNSYEQEFVRMKFSSMFVVGVRSFASLIVTGLIGIVLYVVPAIPNTLQYIGYYPFFILFFCLFLIAIFAKNLSQMSVIKQSNAVTRNLFMQVVPSLTWILSLSLHYGVLNETGNPGYGEPWRNAWDMFRVVGFVIVFLGAVIFIKYKEAKKVTPVQACVVNRRTV
eukprot:266822_1